MGSSAAIEVVGLGIPFEDLPVGRKFRTISRTITEPDLMAFVAVTGISEVLFTNLEFLKEESDIKGRVVPAALPYTMAEGLLAQHTMQHTGFAFLNMELNVERPCFVNDTIYVEVEIIEARASKSRPNRGIVRSRNRIIKQTGEVAIVYTPLRMVKGRGKE